MDILRIRDQATGEWVTIPAFVIGNPDAQTIE